MSLLFIRVGRVCLVFSWYFNWGVFGWVEECFCMLTVGNWWVTLGKCLSTDCGLPFHFDSVCFPPFSAGIKPRASPTPPLLYSPYRVLLKSKGFNCDKVLFIDFFLFHSTCFLFCSWEWFSDTFRVFFSRAFVILTLMFRLVPLG